MLLCRGCGAPVTSRDWGHVCAPPLELTDEQLEHVARHVRPGDLPPLPTAGSDIEG